MTKLEQNKIHWAVVCVNEFAKAKNLSVRESFDFLYSFGGITFLKEYYESEHTLSFDDAVEDLEIICKKNGGNIAMILYHCSNIPIHKINFEKRNEI